MGSMTTDHVASGNSELFYNELVPFPDFADFVELDAYEPVPNDWVVMITDVRPDPRAAVLLSQPILVLKPDLDPLGLGQTVYVSRQGAGKVF
jgi:hypothetical protein